MVQRTPVALATLYEVDETAWLEATAELVRAARWEDIDSENLAEYLDDMARRDRREVNSRLTTLLAHVLKWTYQPERRSNSWRATIIEQRQELQNCLGRGVLRNHAQAVLAEAYVNAVEQATAETGLAAATFPTECAYTLDELLSPELLAE